MMKRSVAFLFLGTILVANSARAADVAQLAKDKHCFDCHSTNSDRVGPSFRDIGRRFNGLNNARHMLARAIEVGTDNSSTAYHWGPTKMPPGSVRVPVSQDEAELLADYVLSFH